MKEEKKARILIRLHKWRLERDSLWSLIMQAIVCFFLVPFLKRVKERKERPFRYKHMIEAWCDWGITLVIIAVLTGGLVIGLWLLFQSDFWKIESMEHQITCLNNSMNENGSKTIELIRLPPLPVLVARKKELAREFNDMQEQKHELEIQLQLRRQ